jgi:hypothetical protein
MVKKQKEDMYADVREVPAMTLEQVDESLIINKNKLDEENVMHPHLVFQVTKEYAEAVSVEKEAKYNIKIVSATLSLHYRNLAVESGEKTTEARLEALVSSDPRYLGVVSEYAEAVKTMELWKGAVDAFKDRGWSIRELGGLYEIGYYSIDAADAGSAAAQLRQARIEKNKKKS